MSSALKAPQTLVGTWAQVPQGGASQTPRALANDPPLAALSSASSSDFWALTAAAPPGASRLDATLKKAKTVRHGWKNARLVARLAGLYSYVRHNGSKFDDLDFSHGVSSKAMKLIKKLGRGGAIRPFLQDVKIFTRSMRLGVGIGRTAAAPTGQQGQKAVEEVSAFVGNRLARRVARKGVRIGARHLLPPLTTALHLNPASAIVATGVLGALAPWGASIVGGRAARRGVRSLGGAACKAWKPVQSIDDFDLSSINARDAKLIEIGTTVAEALTRHARETSGARSLISSNAAALAPLGYHPAGCASDGVEVYRRDDVRLSLKPCSLDSASPGPLSRDEVPMHVVIEWWPGGGHGAEPLGSHMMEGYLLSGGLFSRSQWAALKGRYDEELRAYERACAQSGELADRPTDRASLKTFIASGRSPKHRKKEQIRALELEQASEQLVRQLRALRDQGRAPRGVVLYMEGLDCTGKSSTGGRLGEALREAGFDIETRAYNRPPTPQEKKQPWMNRFERPTRTDEARNWDRGPGGDFVYGALAAASNQQKQQRYNEFRDVEQVWRKQGVLLFKMMFVADRETIARTIGKRLAQRQIARELRAQLRVHSPASPSDGLDEIESHIDPTDFVAFNAWEENLRRFHEFASNTATGDGCSEWLVVSTCKRHTARLRLLEEFGKQVGSFAATYLRNPPTTERERAAAQARFSSPAALFGVGLLP